MRGRNSHLAFSAFLLAGIGASYPAHATLVIGTFDADVIEVHDQFVPPDTIEHGDIATGTFIYDTSIPMVVSDPFFAEYTFTSDAFLRIDSGGFTVGAHATAANPIEIFVSTQSFRISGGAPDAGNNFPPINGQPTLPVLSLVNGCGITDCFSSPFPLPTATFPLHFMDNDADWAAADGSGFAVRFRLDHLSIAAVGPTEVPEPSTLATLGVDLMALALLCRVRRGRIESPGGDEHALFD